MLLDNTSAWAADHCMDPVELPGVLFSNRPVASATADLTDLGPSILTHFGLPIPGDMTGKNIFKVYALRSHHDKGENRHGPV